IQNQTILFQVVRILHICGHEDIKRSVVRYLRIEVSGRTVNGLNIDIRVLRFELTDGFIESKLQIRRGGYRQGPRLRGRRRAARSDKNSNNDETTPPASHHLFHGSENRGL